MKSLNIYLKGLQNWQLNIKTMLKQQSGLDNAIWKNMKNRKKINFF